MKKKVLVVGGTFDRNGGKPSGLISKLCACLLKENVELVAKNGGSIKDMRDYFDITPNYDYVFWFANVSNDEEKIRDVKLIAPRVMLITSKRNDFIDHTKTAQKYDLEELLQRALAIKANLCFEFCKMEDKVFRIRVFDPLGCVWYEGTDIEEAVKRTIKRLDYLSSVTRKPSVKVGEEIGVIFNKDDKEFLGFVKKSGETFHKLMCLPPDVKRFVGNASLRFKTPTRCMNGFPAMRKGNCVLISKRNVDKTIISEKDFVPCFLGENGEVSFLGDAKPSVDSPVQLRLLDKLPNIDYVLHGHCYVKGAPFTSKAIPCGAVEEAGEVLETIEKTYESLEKDFYTVNLKGHGCLILAGVSKIEEMKKQEFFVRDLPEIM